MVDNFYLHTYFNLQHGKRITGYLVMDHRDPWWIGFGVWVVPVSNPN